MRVSPGFGGHPPNSALNLLFLPHLLDFNPFTPALITGFSLTPDRDLGGKAVKNVKSGSFISKDDEYQ